MHIAKCYPCSMVLRRSVRLSLPSYRGGNGLGGVEKYPNLHTYLVAELGLHPRSGGLCRVWKDGARKPHMGKPAQLTAWKRVSVMDGSISFLSNSGSETGAGGTWQE